MDAIQEPHQPFRPRASAGRQSAVLAVVVGLLMLAVGPLAYRSAGLAGVAAAAIAAGACLAGAISAAVISGWFHDPEHALYEVLFGLMFRMAVPLALCMVVMLRGGRLVEAGFPYYVLIFYLATLAISTAMSLPAGKISEIRRAS